MFEITDRDGGARCGRLHTAHGIVETPVFMPVGTQATVKSMTPHEVADLGAEIILGNTYHLAVRPGAELIERCGGLHRFMGWDRAILTDSGGYQVFSLARLRKIRPEGVEFNSHVDGKRLFLGPVEAMAIQRCLGSDIAMVFDECIPPASSRDYACKAIAQTLRWAALCREQPRHTGQLVFGITQGGGFADLRRGCTEALVPMDFDGYAIGGLSVGEPEAALLEGIRVGVEGLPEDKPRYLMGVGRLPQLLEAMAQGVDMFDCVMPTRYARNGTAFTRRGRFPVKAGAYREDTGPIEAGCGCYACAHFSRAYIRHLLNVDEILGVRLMTIHNVHWYLTFMREVRQAIRERRFAAYRDTFLADYSEPGDTGVKEEA